jgi:hypothetical protein
MSGERDMERLEGRLAELEGLVGSLDGADDAEAVDLLERSATLLEEVTALLEASLAGAEGEAREVSRLVERLEFGRFDRALAEAEDLSERGPR